MAVVDASVWVAYFHPQDKFHQAATEIMQKLIRANEEILLPRIAATEVAGVIRRVTGFESMAERALQRLRDLDCQYWDIDSVKVAPLADSIAIKYACRGADACYIAVASIANDTLWSFDKGQKASAANIVKVGESVSS